MLQQEGLIEASPDQQAVVASLDLQGIDSLWATRILLEAFSVRMAAGNLEARDFGDLEAAIDGMVHATEVHDMEEFARGHQEFHAVTDRLAGTPIEKLISDIRDRTRTFGAEKHYLDPDNWQIVNRMHQEILDALHNEDKDQSVYLTALHICHRAGVYFADIAPVFEPKATHTALHLLGIGQDALSTAPRGDLV